MNMLLNWSTRAKLAAGFGVMLALLLLVIASASWSGLAIRHEQRSSLERDMQIALRAMEFRSVENRLSSDLLELQLTPNRAAQEMLQKDIGTYVRRADEVMQQLYSLGGADPDIALMLDQVKPVLTDYRRTRQQQIDLIHAGQIEEARQLGIGVQRQRFGQIRSLMDALGEQTERNLRATHLSIDTRFVDLQRSFAVFAALAILVSVVSVLLLTRAIAGPLTELTERAGRMALGAVEQHPVRGERRDEIGLLEANFNQMAGALQQKATAARQISSGDLSASIELLSDQDAFGHAFADMVRSLQDKAEVAREIAAGNLDVAVPLQSEHDTLGQALSAMVSNLREINRELTESTNVLASSAKEVQASTALIAAGAEQTSASVSETTATLEEVKQTAHLTSQKARQVSDSAQLSAEVAQGGRSAVEKAVDGMHRIQTQMSEIAESIVRLSEQTQAIGEIIASVNDLAEQSNLLAVNAAIEAAKAGEQGKGFAVVAQEVKSLAEQSKQATVQVRAILGDIQKATTGAVLATEQGGKAVEAGVQQSNAAGEAIRQLSEGVVESAQAATQIAVSAQQQLAGMDQLALAMDNIRSASEQNVLAAKQSEQAAQNLHDLGLKLQDMLSRYRM
jgi:methyl-accepting chemotaxis protein